MALKQSPLLGRGVQGLVSGHTTDVGSDGSDAAAEECAESEFSNLDIDIGVHNTLRCLQGSLFLTKGLWTSIPISGEEKTKF